MKRMHAKVHSSTGVYFSEPVLPRADTQRFASDVSSSQFIESTSLAFSAVGRVISCVCDSVCVSVFVCLFAL